jgi:hypothetical protein
MVQLRGKHRSPAVEAFVEKLREALGTPLGPSARASSSEPKKEAP